MILVLKVTFQEYYFLIFAPLRDLKFHRICFVTAALKYIYTSAAPVPRISSKLARFRWCTSHYNFSLQLHITMGVFKEMSILKANRTTRTETRLRLSNGQA